MTMRFDLYMGLFDKNTKRQEYDTITAYRIVESETAQRFGGATISEANGIYKHDDGTVIIEPTIKMEILMFDYQESDKRQVKDFVEYLKKFFNQESIAVQMSRVESELW